MSFPKVPERPVRGGFTLFVRKPGAESVPEKKDLAEEIFISPPSGFSISRDPNEALKGKLEVLFGQIDELRERQGRCSACRKTTSLEAIELAESLLTFLSTNLQELGAVYVVLLLGQEPGGTINIDISNRDKEVSFSIHQNIIRAERYFEGTPNSSSILISEPYDKVRELLLWLLR